MRKYPRPVPQQLRYAAGGGGEHGDAAGHRFHQADGDSLMLTVGELQAWEQHQVDLPAAVGVQELPVRHMPCQLNRFG